MGSFSLAYYDRLFVGRPGRAELLEALAEELAGYGHAFGPALLARNVEALSRLRHEHRPAVQNLGLEELHRLEEEAHSLVAQRAAQSALEALVPLFEAEVRALVDGLTSERLRGAPKPPSPFHGG